MATRPIRERPRRGERRGAHAAEHPAAESAGSGRTGQDEIFVVGRKKHSTVGSTPEGVRAIRIVGYAEPWLDEGRVAQAVVDVAA